MKHKTSNGPFLLTQIWARWNATSFSIFTMILVHCRRRRSLREGDSCAGDELWPSLSFILPWPQLLLWKPTIWLRWPPNLPRLWGFQGSQSFQGAQLCPARRDLMIVLGPHLQSLVWVGIRVTSSGQSASVNVFRRTSWLVLAQVLSYWSYSGREVEAQAQGSSFQRFSFSWILILLLSLCFFSTDPCIPAWL